MSVTDREGDRHVLGKEASKIPAQHILMHPNIEVHIEYALVYL